MNSLLKNSIVLIGLVALAAIGYYLFVTEREVTINNSNGSTVDEADLETRFFLQRLGELQQIQLDTSIFADARFRSLVDFSSTVERVPSGRATPFSSPGNF